MKVGYARVSTLDQSLDLQLDALHQAGCDHIFQDIVSGTKVSRPGLDEADSTFDYGSGSVILTSDWKSCYPELFALC